jgi:hypothetical protein
MSFRQIEDLIEDSIILLDNISLSKRDKRELIFNLYKFQYKFDTNNTLFRVREILLENRYLYSVPIQKHIDFTLNKSFFHQLDKDAQISIPAYIPEPEKGNVYLSENKIWFEVNDAYWNRVRLTLPKEEQNVPQDLPVIHLLNGMLNISLHQENKLIAKRWYATFVNSFLDFDLDENDGLPNKFSAWLKNNELKQLRKFIKENTKIFQIEEEDNDDDLYTLADYKTELEFETDPHRRAQIRFLLDFQSSVEDIKTAFENEINYKVDLNKYEFIYQFFRERLAAHWQDGVRDIRADEGMITFLTKNRSSKEHDEELYACIILDYTRDIKTVALKIGIQNSRILKWQDRDASPKPEFQHFIENVFAHVNDEDIEKDKNISDWGGWKYDIKHSKKTLSRRLDSLWAYYLKYYSPIIKIYQESLSNWIGSQNIEDSKNKRNQLLNKKIAFFGNELDFLLFIACLNLKQNDVASANTFATEVEALLKEEMGSEKLRQRIKQGLTYITLGKETYPEISNIYSNRLLENQ